MKLTKTKKSIFIYAFILSCSAFIFGLGYKAQASEQIDLIYTEYYIGTTHIINAGEFQAESFRPREPNLSKINVAVYTVGYARYAMNICKGILTASSQYDCGSDTLIASATTTVGSQYFIFSNYPYLNVGSNYYFTLKYIADVGFSDHGLIQWTGSPATSFGYYDIAMLNTDGSLINPTSPSGNNYDIRFSTYYNDTSLYFNPTVLQEGGIYKNFNSWELISNMPLIDSGNYRTIVYWQNNASSSVYDWSILHRGGNLLLSIDKIQFLTDGYYTAWAKTKFVLDNVATATPIHFYIDNQNGSNNFPEFIETSEFSKENICKNVATSTGGLIDDGRYALECGFRMMVYWLFTPSTSQTQNFISSTETLKQQFPFTVYFDLTNAINSAFLNATSSTNSFSMPFVRTVAGHAQFYMLPVANASSTANAIGTDNASIFRNIIVWIVWIIIASLIALQLIL